MQFNINNIKEIGLFRGRNQEGVYEVSDFTVKKTRFGLYQKLNFS